MGLEVVSAGGDEAMRSGVAEIGAQDGLASDQRRAIEGDGVGEVRGKDDLRGGSRWDGDVEAYAVGGARPGAGDLAEVGLEARG